jgi:hypothetical protein
MFNFISPEMMLLTPDAALYTFINQGALTVDSINDTEEMKAMDVSQSFYNYFPLYIPEHLSSHPVFNGVRVT